MTSCVSPPANSTAPIAEVELYYASCFIGFAVATTWVQNWLIIPIYTNFLYPCSLFGMSILQCYLYFRNHPNDSASLKSIVRMITWHCLIVNSFLIRLLLCGALGPGSYGLLCWKFPYPPGCSTPSAPRWSRIRFIPITCSTTENSSQRCLFLGMPHLLDRFLPLILVYL